MAKFEVGKAYTTMTPGRRFQDNWGCVILRRTEKSVWIFNLVLDEIHRRSIWQSYDGKNECINLDNDHSVCASNKYSGSLLCKLDGGKYASQVIFKNGVRVK